MKLYLLRHGQADWPHWEQGDDLRPLTDKGKREVRRVARFFAKRGVQPELILTSPLPRALQTARLAHEFLGGTLAEEASLKPGATPRHLRALLKKHKVAELMIVGHEPDFSAMVQSLTGGEVKLAKAGLVRVDLDESGKGQLIWLTPPKITAK